MNSSPTSGPSLVRRVGVTFASVAIASTSVVALVWHHDSLPGNAEPTQSAEVELVDHEHQVNANPATAVAWRASAADLEAIDAVIEAETYTFTDLALAECEQDRSRAVLPWDRAVVAGLCDRTAAENDRQRVTRAFEAKAAWTVFTSTCLHLHGGLDETASAALDRYGNTMSTAEVTSHAARVEVTRLSEQIRSRFAGAAESKRDCRSVLADPPRSTVPVPPPSPRSAEVLSP